MSTQRGFAQRNNNLTTLVPRRISTLTFQNITNCAVYKLSISKAHFVGGIYSVDLSQLDLSGNALNFDGTFASLLSEGEPQTIPIVCFVVDIDTVPSVYPGLDMTVFFKNSPEPFLTIGILSASSLAEETFPFPYIVSPPFPPMAGVKISPNITLKSDGDNFNVVASGPGGWLGVPALSVILSAFTGIG
jgi:hypothetical protein